MDDKKFVIANKISFMFFTLYLLTYVLLPIIEKNANYLLFLIFPCIFLISLIINLLIKYNEMKPNSMGSVSKIAAIANILFNGFNLNTVSGSLYVGTADWNEKKKEEIKKYPSITPTWLFVLLLATILSNFIIFMFSHVPRVDTHMADNVILTVSIISIVFILLAQISSTFALLYNNGKKETFKFWRTIIIITISLIIITIYSFISSGFNIHRKKDKENLQDHIQNIEKTLNNN
ncbi:MAG: hypothetical protein ACI4VH_02045 [Clostridia bacterium]